MHTFANKNNCIYCCKVHTDTYTEATEGADTDTARRPTLLSTDLCLSVILIINKSDKKERAS